MLFAHGAIVRLEHGTEKAPDASSGTPPMSVWYRVEIIVTPPPPERTSSSGGNNTADDLLPPPFLLVRGKAMMRRLRELCTLAPALGSTGARGGQGGNAPPPPPPTAAAAAATMTAPVRVESCFEATVGAGGKAKERGWASDGAPHWTRPVAGTNDGFELQLLGMVAPALLDLRLTGAPAMDDSLLELVQAKRVSAGDALARAADRERLYARLQSLDLTDKGGVS